MAHGCDLSTWDTEAGIVSVMAVRAGQYSQPHRLPASALQPVVTRAFQGHPRLCGFLFLWMQALPLPSPGQTPCGWN